MCSMVRRLIVLCVCAGLLAAERVNYKAKVTVSGSHSKDSPKGSLE